ncbi:MAG: molecular chaperone TorD family protein [archaeon]
MTTTNSTADAMSVQDTEAAARGTIYGTLAGLFEEPDESIYEALADGSMAADVDVLVDHAGLSVAVPTLVTDDDYELLCARFNDIFEIGLPDPPVPLYESEYAGEASWDDINLDLARAYDYFGVTVDESNREHHDHLQLELEFAGYLARLAAATDDDGVRTARRDFLDRHLEPFVEQIAAAIDDEFETGVYDDLVQFAAAFVESDLEELDTRLDAEVSPP